MLAVSVRVLPVAFALSGAIVLAASAAGARRDAIPRLEARVFRAVNELPGWLYAPLWLPMQFGNLAVGLVTGLAVAALLGEWAVAVAVVIATVAKLVVERVIRRRMANVLHVRQRPGTSEPGAVLRGDVPPTGPSFPSGHVILAAAIASVLSSSLAAGLVSVPWLLVALVMVGRVYVGAHNPLDVTAGLGAGMVIGGACDILLR